MPSIIVNLDRIGHNIAYLEIFCKSRKISLLGVIKSCEKNLPIMQEFQRHGIEMIGIADLYTARKSSKHVNVQFMLLSIPQPEAAETVVKYCSSSMNSEMKTIRALAMAARKHKKVHDVILMIDIGDLREGVLPEQAIETAYQIINLDPKHLRLSGIGANLGCCSGTLPSTNNLNLLQSVAEAIENELAYPLQIVSIGGSVMLDWMEKNSLPPKINQLRIGEAIVLGTIPNRYEHHKHLKRDAFTFSSNIVEVKSKPSMPTETTGKNAFGSEPVLVNRGIHKRAILNFGSIHTIPENLIPIESNMHLISTNSNYSVYDVTDCQRHFKPGDTIEFKLTYASLVQCLLSPYVQHSIIR